MQSQYPITAAGPCPLRDFPIKSQQQAAVCERP